MNEQGDRLRLVTGTWRDDETDRVDYQVHILGTESVDGDLPLISTLPNDSRPAEIGKPNESLYGVRFAGDRLYMVTFEIIDPLYVIDLSDETDPYIAGELEIPGFSDFLVPLSEDLLMGLGSQGSFLKMELFNVSDISMPLSQDVHLFSEGVIQSRSSATYDRRAYTQLAISDDELRVAIPLRVRTNTEYLNQLAQLEITDIQSPLLAAINEVGRLATDSDSASFYGKPRTILDGEAVFHIREADVWTGFWGSSELVSSPE